MKNLCSSTLIAFLAVASSVRVIAQTDFIPPVISCPTTPAPTTPICAADLPPLPTTLAAFLAAGGTASDNLDANLEYRASENVLPFGRIRRTYTVIDDATNSASCSHDIIVGDFIPPILTCPPGSGVQCPADVPPLPMTLQAFLAIGGGASDNCDTDLEYRAFEEVLPFGRIRRLYTLIDDATNSASCLHEIIVGDFIPPVLTCPLDSRVQCMADVPPLPTTLQAFLAAGGGASDNCDFDLEYHASERVFPGVGGFGLRIERVYTLIDDATNSASCLRYIDVLDTIPPVLTCPPYSRVQCMADVPPLPTTLQAFLAAGGGASDNCDVDLEYQASEMVLPGQGPEIRIQRVYTLIDDATNSASCVRYIDVLDTIPPVLNCPGNIDAKECDPLTIVPVATDNCDGSLPATCSRSDGKALSDSFPLGTTTVICSVADARNNSASCSFTVNIRPNLPPNCFGQLNPQNCTVPFQFNTNIFAIAVDDDEACLVLDGSGSSDPDGDAITVTWIIDGANLVSGTRVPYCLPVGCHSITMTAIDRCARCYQVLDICVITPAEAVEQCILLVDQTDIERKNKRPLIVSLKAAKAALERGGWEAGSGMLKAFQFKVRAQIERDNPGEAATFIQCAENILGALECVTKGERHPGQGH